MSKVSAAVKNKWNSENYDRINLMVSKGEKDRIRIHAGKRGESVNAFVKRAIQETIERDNGGVIMIDKEKYSYSSNSASIKGDKYARALLADKAFTDPLEKTGHLVWDGSTAYFDVDALKRIVAEIDCIQKDKSVL